LSDVVVVDTDILIDVGRNDPVAVERLRYEEQHSALVISTATQMELIVGCRNKKELKALDVFLHRFEIRRISFDITDKAVSLLLQYRLSHGLLIADPFIAATAFITDSALLSKNQKDFKFIRGLRLAKYP